MTRLPITNSTVIIVYMNSPVRALRLLHVCLDVAAGGGVCALLPLGHVLGLDVGGHVVHARLGAREVVVAHGVHAEEADVARHRTARRHLLPHDLQDDDRSQERR